MLSNGVLTRGGVLEDVLGFEDVLEDTFWSPWPWPRRSSPRKLACPRLEDSTSCWIVKILWSAWKFFWKTFFCEDRLKKIFFWRALALVSLALASSIPVLGLESVCTRKGCPWPWPRIFLCPWPWPRALCPRLHLWYWRPIVLAGKS